MEIKFPKQLLVIIMIITAFIFAVSLASLYTQRVISCGEAQTCTIPIPFLIPIIASIGLFVGTLVYFLMAGRMIKKESSVEKCSEIIGKLFSQEEKAILKVLANHKQLSQARIATLTNMPRLKVFRTVEKLKEKDLVEKKEQGKARLIKLKIDVGELIKI